MERIEIVDDVGGWTSGDDTSCGCCILSRSNRPDDRHVSATTNSQTPCKSQLSHLSTQTFVYLILSSTGRRSGRTVAGYRAF